jgi:hypothetical protein
LAGAGHIKRKFLTKKSLMVMVLCMLILLHTPLGAQEAAVQERAGPAGVPTNSFILYGGLFKGYTLPDGTQLSYKALKERLKLAPENEVLLRRAAGWRVASLATLVPVTGSLAAYMVYTFNDKLPDAHEMAKLFYSVEILLAASDILFSLFFQNNMTKAVSNYNYNLSVMGLPVPVR